MDNSMDKYLGKLLDNRYEILEVIGSGGMAVVYKALCHKLNRYVAVKILRDDLAVDKEFRRRFETESKAAGMLSHPNIVSVYDVSRDSNPEYIVMELIEGVTLKQYMTSKGALGWKEVVHFTTQIAKALSHAHSRGIVHRDIKPHNIMIDKDGSIKVADFGIARLENSQNTLTTEALGSVHYISPEQAKGEPVDARSDIYSLGIVMYEMLTGKLPFDGDSPVAVAIQHINSSPTAPHELVPDIPESLEAITIKAMNPDINERYQSADELLADLEAFRKQSSAAVIPQDEELTPAREENALAEADFDFSDMIIKDVKPVNRGVDRSYDGYVRRRSRSKKVSLLSGFFIVLVFMIAVFVFLWNYWMKDIFEDAQRISMPNFVGDYWDDIEASEDFNKMFNFTVVYQPSATIDAGIIMSQTPVPDRSVMLSSNGIDVELTVSSGVEMVKVPDVYNVEYRDAIKLLESKGFTVVTEYVESQTVTQDYAVSTSPAAGESLTIGSTVYLQISGGPVLNTFEMPNLIGMTQAEAEGVIESNRLTLGSVSPVNSNQPVGVVIWQSVDAGTEVNIHTKVYIQISSGPAETDPPEETDTPSEPPAQTDNPPDQPSAPVTPEEPVTPVDPVTPGGDEGE